MILRARVASLNWRDLSRSQASPRAVKTAVHSGWLALMLCMVASPTSGQTQPELVAETPSFTEGIVFDSDGNAYVSEPFRGPITRITPEGVSSEWSATAGANGHKIQADGTHLVCDRVRRAVIRLSSVGQEIGVAATTCGNRLIDSPNDLVLDSHGGFYFTNPTVGGGTGRVCYVDSAGESRLLASITGFPNGIALSPDSTRLFVSDTRNKAIMVFPIRAPGSIGPGSVFASVPNLGTGPDGIAVDAAGNVYVAHYGVGRVQVMNPQGEWIRSVPAGSGNAEVSNVAFGGQSGTQLYITGGDQKGVLYRLPEGVSPLDEEFAVGATGVDDSSQPSDRVTLHRNYPNPFNAATTINYFLPEAAHVSLSVYDVLGREIRILASSLRPSGTHEAHFGAADWPSGIYFYRLEVDKSLQVKQMVLTR